LTFRSPFYGQRRITSKLEQFSEFDQCARYPWVEQKYSNGFDSGEFLPVFWELTKQLRNDIPMPVDNYPLGLGIRGGFYREPTHEVNEYLLLGFEAWGDCAPQFVPRCKESREVVNNDAVPVACAMAILRQ
jgi:hypothetical protein